MVTQPSASGCRISGGIGPPGARRRTGRWRRKRGGRRTAIAAGADDKDILREGADAAAKVPRYEPGANLHRVDKAGACDWRRRDSAAGGAVQEAIAHLLSACGMRSRTVADQLQAAPEAEARAAMLVRDAGWLGGGGEPGGVADVAVNVEVADAGEPGVPNDWRGLDAQIDTEAWADVLSACGSASAGRLVEQDVARCGLDPEIYVRTAEQLDIDEGAAAEIRARVVDAKMAGGIGKAKTE